MGAYALFILVMASPGFSLDRASEKFSHNGEMNGLMPVWDDNVAERPDNVAERPDNFAECPDNVAERPEHLQ